jgi:hypothetical protein
VCFSHRDSYGSGLKIQCHIVVPMGKICVYQWQRRKNQELLIAILLF